MPYSQSIVLANNMRFAPHFKHKKSLACIVPKSLHLSDNTTSMIEERL